MNLHFFEDNRRTVLFSFSLQLLEESLVSKFFSGSQNQNNQIKKKIGKIIQRRFDESKKIEETNKIF